MFNTGNKLDFSTDTYNIITKKKKKRILNEDFFLKSYFIK